MSFKLQEWIHRMEEGAGVGTLKAITLAAVFVVLAMVHNNAHYKNFSTAEAMDTAQLARNIAEGKGYTTKFLRPVSLWMVEKKAGNMLLDAHPDLANAPVYPYFLAGWMKLWPAAFGLGEAHGISAYTFWPEQAIGRLNEGLFFVALCLVFWLARRLFDSSVAWLSVVVLAGLDLFWRFAISGLSTMLLLVLVLLLVWCLVAAEQGAREKQWGTGRLLFMALLAGVLAGACGLTRYSFLCLILPTVIFFVAGVDRLKPLLAVATVVGFCAVVAPWLMRNYEVSGTMFGAAGLAAHEDTLRFPGNRLERTLHPDNPDTTNDLGKVNLWEYWDKLWVNLPQLMQNDLPRLGGSWVVAFFLVGMLVPFRSPTLSRLRWFMVFSLALLTIIQAMGRTHLTAASPDVNSENLLVLLAPLITVYGVGLYFILMERVGADHPAMRGFANTLFVLFGCAPLIVRLVAGSTGQMGPLAYPPYYPAAVQECGSWVEKDELMMSDVPWAVAWYGKRSCVWCTMDIQKEFYAINARKKIAALYLTQLTLDGRLLSDLTTGRERELGRQALRALVRDDPKTKDTIWGNFAWEMVMKEEVPDGFPLTEAAPGSTAVGSLFPEQMYLTDRPRWAKKGQ